ncbi:MAG: HigA family addiction module antidote protein [Desulfobacterales bacterium]|nr:HigA family addiction module antidote protein [Desulfobacterales bacterium]
MMRLPTNRPPVHPGEILLKEFMIPHKLTQTEIASRIGVTKELIHDLINGRKGIDANLALRLSRLFSTSPELWMNGQSAWDMWHLMHGNIPDELEAIEPIAV